MSLSSKQCQKVHPLKANLHYNELKNRSCQEPKDCGIMLVRWGLKENTEIPGKACSDS